MEFVATGICQSAAQDAIAACQASRILFDPEAWHELRALPFGRSAFLKAGDQAAMTSALRDFEDARGIYYCLNPVAAALDSATRDRDIHSRRNLLIDVDPIRPDGLGDQSATEEEKAAASRLASELVNVLFTRGWPAPVVVDSGNGTQLVYLVDLGSDKLTHTLIKTCLRNLASEFDADGAKIDVSVHNASRIAKLPGTWARKGADTPDRPWRLAKILYSPPERELVPIAAIQAIAAKQDRPADQPSANGHAHKAASSGTFTATGREDKDYSKYVHAAIANECAAVAATAEGERNDRLNVAAFKLGTLLNWGVVSRAEVERALSDAARQCGLGEHEASATIKSGITGGIAKPREKPSADDRDTRTASFTAQVGRPARLTVRASEVSPKRVNWLWQDRVPYSFITVFAGRTGLGKSFVVCDLIARMTKGREAPESGGEVIEPGQALFISEDPHDYMLTPRLIECGADLQRVSFFTWEAMAQYTLSDTSYLDQALAEIGVIRMLVIDPPTNFLGGRDEHKNSEVRQTIMKIVAWLQDKSIACIFLLHVNKQAAKGVEALNRILGSVAWASTSRIAHSFSPDPDKPGQVFFVPMKNNLGQLASGLAYEIVKTDSLAVVEWRGEVDLTADQAMEGGRGKPRRVQAAEWLVEKFREKLEWRSDELFKTAKAEGVAERTIWDAKRDLGLPKARKITDQSGDQHWIWFVPPDWPPLVQQPP